MGRAFIAGASDPGYNWPDLGQGDCEIQFKELRFSFVSIDQIKEAIGQLSFAERAELAAWLHGWKDDDWDEQMKRDIASGKLDHVLREVDDDIRSGRLSSKTF